MPQARSPSSTAPPAHTRRALVLLCRLLAVLYALMAAAAMLWLSPRVPYADTWHFDTQLLAQPFPGNVLMVDNGHAQLLPRLLRWLELRQWHGNQWPTIIAGMLFLAASLWLWITTDAETAQTADRTRHRLVRAAWLLTGVAGLCWLGNGRTLAHGNEAIHSYLIIACLLAALRLVAKPGGIRLTAALALAVVASLSFGTGAAVFAAIAVALILRHARWPELLVTVAGAALAAGLYLLLPKAVGGTGVIVLQPILQLTQLARWLGSPWLVAGGPLVDASVLDKLPAVTQPLAAPLAHLSTALFGPARTAIWPELGLGLAGIALLITLTWQLWRQPQRYHAAAAMALGCSWFALVCGVLVVLARTDAFLQYPDQVYATRYAVWYTLFWCGLLGAALWRLHAAGHSGRALVLALAIAIGLLPATGWNGFRAVHMSRIAARDALGVRVGVIDRNGDHGENWIHIMQRARPLLLAHGTSIFAPSRGPLVGAQLDPATPAWPLRKLAWQPVDNALRGAGARTRFMLQGANGYRVLLVNADWRIIGEARPAPGQGRWQGWALGSAPPAKLRGVTLDDAIAHTIDTPGASAQ